MSEDISIILGNKINIENGEGENSIQQVGNTILGDYSFAAGCDNTSVRDHTILIGYNLQSWGEYQVLLGTSNGTTQPTYESSLSIFTQTKGEVFWVHKSTGNIRITTNLFVASLITGTGCEVKGENSIVAGSWSITRLKNRFAFGSSLDTGSYDSVPSATVIGFLNQPEDGDVFQVGIGTTSQGRKNGFRVLSDGRAKVAGAPIDDVDVVRKTELNGYVPIPDPAPTIWSILVYSPIAKTYITYPMEVSAQRRTVPFRDTKGNFKVGNLTADDDGQYCANKKFVEDAIAKVNPQTFKTLFGNQNVAGTGNIDLYEHDIQITGTNIDVICTIYSSKNVKIDSLTDLKTVAGDTFIKPCTGVVNGKIAYALTQTSIKLTDGTTQLLTGVTFADNMTTI